MPKFEPRHVIIVVVWLAVVGVAFATNYTENNNLTLIPFAGLVVAFFLTLIALLEDY